MYKMLRRNSPLSIITPDFSVFRQQLDCMSAYCEKRYSSILDYGAGNAPYRSFFTCDTYITVDVEQNSSGTIDIVIEKADPVIGLPCESVELILCMDVLEHVYDDKKTLSTLHSLLKPAGLIMLSLPFLYREHEFPYDYRRYTSSGIHGLLSEAGFTSIHITKIGNPLFVVWNLFYERHIRNFENDETGSIAKIFWKIFHRTLLPALNSTLFKVTPKKNDSIFSRMLVVASKD